MFIQAILVLKKLKKTTSFLDPFSKNMDFPYIFIFVVRCTPRGINDQNASKMTCGWSI